MGSVSHSTGTGITQDVDVLILGGEPAAGWFAQELQRTNASSLIWVRPELSARRVLLPEMVAKHFGLSLSDPFSLELAFPEERYLWNDEALARRFPAAAAIPQSTSFTAAAMEEAEKALRQTPHLLSVAQGIWKATGRCLWPRPGALVLNALMCTRLGWWESPSVVPSSTQTIETWEHPLEDLEEIKPESRGRWLVKWKGRAPLLAHSLLLALDGPELRLLCQRFEGLLPKLGIEFADILDTRAVYSFEVEAQPSAIPWPTSALALFYQTSTLPEPLHEVWPVRFTRTEQSARLVAEVIGPANISLEYLFDQFRLGLGMLYRNYPFLPLGLRHLFPTLDMDSCASPEARLTTSDELTRRALPLYRQTSLELRTKAGNVFILAPFTYCHLPYPLGTLTAARELLRLWPRKKKGLEKPQPSVSP